MHTKRRFFTGLLATVTLIASTLIATPAWAGPESARAAQVAAHWSAERRQAAIPRDLRIDSRGLAYLRKPNGALEPYGHSVAAQAANPEARRPPPSGGDITPPIISELSPADDAVIGASQLFSAKITDDPSGVKSASVVIQLPSGATQSFNTSRSGETYSVLISGFSNGNNWGWWVQAKDGAKKGGNSATSEMLAFCVNTDDPDVCPGSEPGPDPDPDPDVVTSAPWTDGGTVQTAAGRIYFEMPRRRNRRQWDGYVCSGTVIGDNTGGRSIILTAAHCVYDDANKAYARNVLFIPNQAATTGNNGTDLDCSNDPVGCWAPAFGVVDNNWTAATFPNNIPWDYAYYVVSDSDAHEGAGEQVVLDAAASPMAITFDEPTLNAKTHALGYSYSEDPKFMYCAEDITTEGSYNDWWLGSCALSGGSSGGPWTQSTATDLGTGPVMSVNSWGYTGQPGMAGPLLYGNSAACLLGRAKSEGFPSNPGDGNAGVAGCTVPPSF